MVRLNPRSFRVVEKDSATGVMRSVEGPDHVGAFLREARENLGKPLPEIAQTLRIRRNYLEAIEDGRFSELPGATYAVGFVRSYAQFLRLDTRSVVERFKQEAAGIETPLHLDFPTPLPEGRFPGGAVVAFCVMLAIGIFAGWYWFQSQKATEVALVPVSPAVPAAGPEAPIEETTTTPSPSPTAAAPERVAPAEPAAAAAAADEVPTYGAPAQTAPGLAEAPAGEAQPPFPAQPAPEQPESAEPAEGSTTEQVVTEQPATGPVAEVAPAREAGEGEGGETVAPAAPAAVPETAAAREPAEGEAGEDDSVQISALPPAPENAPAEPRAAPSTSPRASVPDVDSAAPAPLPAVPALPVPTGDDSRVYGVVNQDARIVLQARSTSWVQVRDGAQNVLLTQMLRPGDRYYVPNRSGLTLQTGNAGGLEVSVDGSPVPALGGEGAVLRDVRLDADLLRSGTAVLQ